MVNHFSDKRLVQCVGNYGIEIASNRVVQHDAITYIRAFGQDIVLYIGRDNAYQLSCILKRPYTQNFSFFKDILKRVGSLCQETSLLKSTLLSRALLLTWPNLLWSSFECFIGDSVANTEGQVFPFRPNRNCSLLDAGSLTVIF